MYLYAIYIDKVLIYIIGVEHIKGDMFENVPKGHAIFMKVSFISKRHYVLIHIYPRHKRKYIKNLFVLHRKCFSSYLIVSIIPHPIDLVMAQNIIRNDVIIG